MTTKEKYHIDQLQGMDGNLRIIKVGLVIANELHRIHSVLKTLKQNNGAPQHKSN